MARFSPFRIWRLIALGTAIASAPGAGFARDVSPELPTRFDHFDASMGLPNDWVRCVMQDDADRIWVGSSDGLSFFDGSRFWTYRPQDAQSGRELRLTTNTLLSRKDGGIWVGSNNGLYRFSPETGEFAPEEALIGIPVICLFRDHAARLWVGTAAGLFHRPAGTSGSWTRFEHDPDEPDSLTHSYVNVVSEDRHGNLWVGTKQGLNRFQSETGGFQRFPPGTEPDQLLGGDVRGLEEDAQGRLWIGTARSGIQRLVHDPSGHPGFEHVLPGKAIAILIDRANRLWVAFGSGGGLGCVDLNRFHDGGPAEIHRWQADPLDPHGLRDDSLFSLFEDRWGDLWIGTFEVGLQFLSARSKPFHTLERRIGDARSLNNGIVTAVLRDGPHLWIGTEGGLHRKDLRDDTVTRFEHDERDPETLSSNSIQVLFRDHRGILWVGTWAGGLNRFVPESERFVRYLPGGPGSLSSEDVYAIAEDGQGRLLVGTLGGGLNRYDPATDRFEHWVHEPDDPHSLPADFVNTILVTHAGEILVSTYGDLCRFDAISGRFTRFDPGFERSHGNLILDLHEDARGGVWVCAEDGLERFDPATGEFEQLDFGARVEPFSAQTVCDDDNGTLWVGTRHGLLELENLLDAPDQLIIREYSTTAGLPSEEFTDRASFRDEDGTLYLGTSRGLVSFDPSAITTNSEPPRVVLTAVSVLRSSLDRLSQFEPFGKGLHDLEHLDLRYGQADFTVRYAALNYLNPEENRYRYFLEGHDKDWIAAGTRQTATYTNLHPGPYTFRVRGSNNDGVWSEEAASLAIVVHPPWWMTTWFRAIVILSVVLVLIGAYRLRVRLLTRRQRELEAKVAERTGELEANQRKIERQNAELDRHRNQLEAMVEERTRELVAAKVKAEESDRLKSSFLDNLSHEIRTPMNAIIGFSHILRDSPPGQEDLDHYVELVEQNFRSLLRLIDDILDVSLLQTNQLKMEREPVELDELLADLEDQWNAETSKAIRFHQVAPPPGSGGIILDCDRSRLQQIFNNLLANAEKFTDEGVVRFGYRLAADHLKCFVSDEGIGIPPDDAEKIFAPFYKVEHANGRLYGGTGIGLSLARYIVVWMGGRMWVDPTVEAGATFRFALPLRWLHQPSQN